MTVAIKELITAKEGQIYFYQELQYVVKLISTLWTREKGKK